MKTIYLMISAILVTAAAAHSSETKISKMECLLNKSNSLIIEIASGERGVERATVAHKNFLESQGQVFATLDHPSVIRYGNVLMLSQNSGRSGYSFLRLERQENGQFEGWFDINLFFAQAPAEMKGRLINLPCVLR